MGYHPYDLKDYNGRCGPVVAAKNPGVVKLADTSDLGSDPRGYGFKSLRPDQFLVFLIKYWVVGNSIRT